MKLFLWLLICISYGLIVTIYVITFNQSDTEYVYALAHVRQEIRESRRIRLEQHIKDSLLNH